MNDIIEECLKDESRFEGCKLCFGKGYITAWTQIEGYRCPRCKGNGIIDTTCPECGGNGLTGSKINTLYGRALIACSKCYGKGRTTQ